ncbi:sirohydrochlorin chelatase [Vasconcelosia minhoensis]|nr:sirohydrochlorin chelatase [Romeria gracilis]
MSSTAYLLISHGSRDPRPQEAMARLARLVRRRLMGGLAGQPSSAQANPPSKAPSSPLLTSAPSMPPASTVRCPSEVIVGTACLELAPLPLSQQIYEFGRRLQAAGVTQLKLLPVFLMNGVHVAEDIPAEVGTARQLLGDTLELTLCPYLGSHERISALMAAKLASIPAEGSLLVAHGSRRPRGNRPIDALAQRLGTAVAYWSTPPDLESQAISLMQQGCQRLTVLPYFLFAGGITDAIAHLTEELAERFPRISFRLLPVLGASAELADIVVELVRSEQDSRAA